MECCTGILRQSATWGGAGGLSGRALSGLVWLSVMGSRPAWREMRCYWEVAVDAVPIRGGDGYGVGHCNKTYAAHAPSGRCCTAWWLMGAAGVWVNVLDGIVGKGRLPFVGDVESESDGSPRCMDVRPYGPLPGA